MPRTASRNRVRKAASKPAAKKLLSFDVFDYWSGALQFTAQINCKPEELPSVKMGLAVQWAVKNGASLVGASLVGARLDGARLVGARLDGASLDGASLDGARLVGASLVGASLVGASLVGASLVGASLDGASLVGASLVGASLDGARLDGARLDGARLDGARLVGASLVGARLDGARLDGARLVGASLVGARFDGALIESHTLAAGKSWAALGWPDGWFSYTFLTKEGVQRVRIGCRDKTIAEGRVYWANKNHRREVFAALDYAEAIGRARGWIVAASAQQAAE